MSVRSSRAITPSSSRASCRRLSRASSVAMLVEPLEHGFELAVCQVASLHATAIVVRGRAGAAEAAASRYDARGAPDDRQRGRLGRRAEHERRLARAPARVARRRGGARRGVPDEIDAIAEFVNRERERVDHLIVTGGLGGTPDDLTREALAAAFAVTTGAGARARRRAPPTLPTPARLRRPLGAPARGQPAAAKPARRGPGLRIANVWALPGLPAEMEAMFDAYPGSSSRASAIAVWRARFATGEGEIVELLAAAYGPPARPGRGRFLSPLRTGRPGGRDRPQSWLDADSLATASAGSSPGSSAAEARPAGRWLSAARSRRHANVDGRERRPSPRTILAELNEAPREAVTTTEGPLLVLAGAGSGKTRVITHRIARLVERGVPPGAIVALTFTNKAAGEMRERVASMLGKGGRRAARRDLTISTFHSFGLGVLGRERDGSAGRRFTIFDQGDQPLAREAAPARRSGADRALRRRTPSSRASRTRRTPSSIGRRVCPSATATPTTRGRRASTAATRPRSRSFNARSTSTTSCARSRGSGSDAPTVRARWQSAYRYVLVDEYQDTNRAQLELLRLLAGEHRNLCAVGDDDQAIYGWRGADVRNILDFEAHFPGAQVDQARAELPLGKRDPEGRERGDRPQPRAQGEAALVGARRRASRWRSSRPRTSTAEARFVAAEVAGLRRGRDEPGRDRRRLPHQRPEPSARGRARARRRRLPGDRRRHVLRARRDQGRDRLPAA